MKKLRNFIAAAAANNHAQRCRANARRRLIFNGGHGGFGHFHGHFRFHEHWRFGFQNTGVPLPRALALMAGAIAGASTGSLRTALRRRLALPLSLPRWLRRVPWLLPKRRSARSDSTLATLANIAGRTATEISSANELSRSRPPAGGRLAQRLSSLESSHVKIHFSPRVHRLASLPPVASRPSLRSPLRPRSPLSTPDRPPTPNKRRRSENSPNRTSWPILEASKSVEPIVARLPDDKLRRSRRRNAGSAGKAAKAAGLKIMPTMTKSPPISTSCCKASIPQRRPSSATRRCSKPKSRARKPTSPCRSGSERRR